MLEEEVAAWPEFLLEGGIVRRGFRTLFGELGDAFCRRLGLGWWGLLNIVRTFAKDTGHICPEVGRLQWRDVLLNSLKTLSHKLDILRDIVHRY